MTATTTYSDGSPHKAVDIAPGSCNYWGAETGIVGSVYWTVTIRTTTAICNGNGSGMPDAAPEILRHCTICERTASGAFRFHSYRRDASTARQRSQILKV